MKLFKRRDLVIIAMIVLVIIASALLLTRGGGARVNVYVGGGLYESLDASEPRTVTVDQGDGRINVVEITATGVRMASSTCPHQDCVMQGELPFAGGAGLLSGWIICLPNGVSVEIAP